jgi:hypothetical protein
MMRWDTHRSTGSVQAMITETTASKIHIAQAKFRAHSPHAGTQTKTNMLMIVAKPMGKVPMNID